jgi:dipeptidyl aminopeptidase/acylaminoacyl peptidase
MRCCQDGLAAIAGLPMRFDKENMARLFRCLFRFPLLLICLLFLPAAWADEMPQLTLEAGMHSARINDAAADDDGRWLVTVSDDKSARFWNLDDGRLLSIMRVPAREGSEGSLNAVALAPNGEHVAIAGQTGPAFSAARRFSIYVFDPATARMQQVLPGLDHAVATLAWSPDGNYLLAGMQDTGGIVLFDMRSGRWLAADGDYDATVSGIDFSTDGKQIAVASRDGWVRRYRFSNSSLKREALRLISGGGESGHLHFSPDGNLIALGMADRLQVQVLQADDLSLAWMPSMRGMTAPARERTGLATVAWSADADRLCAGGSWMRGSRAMIRCWDSAEPTRYADFPGAEGSLASLQILTDGRIATTGHGPGWALLSAGGSVLSRRGPPAQTVENDGLRVSPDGTQVALWLKDAGVQAFSLTEGRMAEVPPQFLAEKSAGAGLREALAGTSQPVFHGHSLALPDHEIARMAAIASDGKYLVISTDTQLTAFNANAQRQWSLPVSGPARQLAISENGRWVVAMSRVGILTWFRASDGTPVLHLFMHADQKRWVMWTPAGYYEASEGGENLFGWLLSERADAAADFFPAGRFRQRFRRPDLVAHAFEVNPSPPASGMLGQIAPPTLSVLPPGNEIEATSPRIHLRVAIRSLGEAMPTGISVRVGGEPVEVAQPHLPVKQGRVPELVHEFDVEIPQHDTDILVFASNRNGVSAPATVHVHWEDPLWDQQQQRPKLYVLAVGVSRYALPEQNLAFPAKDARDFVAALRQGSASLYRDVEVRMILDDKSGRDEILEGLDWLRHQVTHRDVAVLFLAGHGVTDDDGTYYFLPWGGDPDHLKRSGVIYHEIRNTLTALPGKALLFIDTCHAGNVLGSTARRAGNADMAAMINELTSAENGVIVFSASTGRQYSLENPAWGNGAFTKALVEGLKGAADYRKTGRITYKMLDVYVSERVKTLTGGKQTPVTIIPQGVPDFPVVALPAASK